MKPQIDAFLRRPVCVALPLIALVACTHSSGHLQEGVPVDKAAGIGQSPTPRIIVQDKAGGNPRSDYSKPVITETKVCTVWVPTHLDPESDIIVYGHFVGFKVRPAEWVLPGSDLGDDEPRPPLTNGADVSHHSLHPGLRQGFGKRDWIHPYRIQLERAEEPSEGEESNADRE
jgi:hypothetical protein